MRKRLSLIVTLIFLASSLPACQSKAKLDLASFEKYALQDLHLEKTDSTTWLNNAYYDLDHTIDPASEESLKLDHTAQVYSTADGNVASAMAVVYNDYQDKKEAKAYFESLVASEKEMLSSETKDHVIKEGSGYLLVLTVENRSNWTFECLYYQSDVILFVSINIGASDVRKINQEWLKNVKTFFSDLNLTSPFTLSPDIDKLA
ncbi:MAG: hypothetical protein IKG93_10920 [Clostridiales bacterium]|nr:hypothetical protein [Clostridiales bacterium]